LLQAASSSLCGWWTSCCSCRTLRKAGAVIPWQWRKEEEFETAVEENFTEWRELEVGIAATVGPPTQIPRIFRSQTWKKALIRAAAAIVYLLQGDCSSPHPESKPQTSCSHCFTYWNLSRPNLRWHKLFKILWPIFTCATVSKGIRWSYYWKQKANARTIKTQHTVLKRQGQHVDLKFRI
jgi:hypothetical protein